MNFRERFRANINKNLTALKVIIPDAAIAKLVEQAFAIVSDTRINWNRVETRPNNHNSTKTERFVLGHCPELAEDCEAFVKSCITDKVVADTRDSIKQENSSKRNNYNRVIDFAHRYLEDYDKKVDTLYTSYVDGIAKEYAKRDAQKIYDSAKEHFLKQR
jgi:hypothetical protein